MGVMKEFDRRIRAGGDDAIAAVAELWESREKILFDITDAFTKARWIPAEERLPRPGQEVLIFHRATDADGTPSCIGDDGNGGLITTATFERIEGQALWTSEYGDETPTHWMPLPEPPEVE